MKKQKINKRDRLQIAALIMGHYVAHTGVTGAKTSKGDTNRMLDWAERLIVLNDKRSSYVRVRV